MNRAYNFILSSGAGLYLDLLVGRWTRYFGVIYGHVTRPPRGKVAALALAVTRPGREEEREKERERERGTGREVPTISRGTIEKIRRFIYPARGLHGSPIADSRSFHAGNKHSSRCAGVKCARFPAKSIHPTYLSEDLSLSLFLSSFLFVSDTVTISK